MGLGLVECHDDGLVAPSEMQKGQVGVIVRWGDREDYYGHSVQMGWDGTLRNLETGGGWHEASIDHRDKTTHAIRLLETGETLRVR